MNKVKRVLLTLADWSLAVGKVRGCRPLQDETNEGGPCLVLEQKEGKEEP